MVLSLTESKQKRYSDNSRESHTTGTDELVAFCPGCKALETLWFSNGKVALSRKFNQQSSQVYHDCGTSEPCRLYRL